MDFFFDTIPHLAGFLSLLLLAILLPHHLNILTPTEHYNEPINIDDYAKENHFSTSWFIRNFKLYTGITPKQYILKKRIYNAEALLQNTQYNINEIAQIIGYDNPLYFSRVFQKTKGISPSEYRKNISQRVFSSPSL